MIEFIGGAFHNAGLTFFSMAARVTILWVAEVVIGAMFILGLFPRVAAVAVVIIMLGAMNTKGRAGTTFVEKDFMLAIIAIVLFATGAGSYSLTAACCGEACDTENK